MPRKPRQRRSRSRKNPAALVSVAEGLAINTHALRSQGVTVEPRGVFRSTDGATKGVEGQAYEVRYPSVTQYDQIIIVFVYAWLDGGRRKVSHRSFSPAVFLEDHERVLDLELLAMEAPDWEAKKNPARRTRRNPAPPSLTEKETALVMVSNHPHRWPGALNDVRYAGVFRFLQDRGPKRNWAKAGYFSDLVGHAFVSLHPQQGPIYFFVVRRMDSNIAVLQYRDEMFHALLDPVPDLERLAWEAPEMTENNPQTRILQPWKWGQYNLFPSVAARARYNPTREDEEEKWFANLTRRLALAEGWLLQAQSEEVLFLNLQGVEANRKRVAALQSEVRDLKSRREGAIQRARGRIYLRSLKALPKRFTYLSDEAGDFARKTSAMDVPGAVDLLNMLIEEPEFAVQKEEEEEEVEEEVEVEPRKEPGYRIRGAPGRLEGSLLKQQPSQVKKAVSSAVRRFLPEKMKYTPIPIELRQNIFNAWTTQVLDKPNGRARQSADTGDIEITGTAQQLQESMLPIAEVMTAASGLKESFKYGARFKDPEVRQKATEGFVAPIESLTAVREVEEDKDPFPLLTEMEGRNLSAAMRSAARTLVLRGVPATRANTRRMVQMNRTRAMLIRTHLGISPSWPEPGIQQGVTGFSSARDPGAAKRPRKERKLAWLSQRGVYIPKLGEHVIIEGKAALDAKAYHGRRATKKGPCPTCVALTKYVRIPGVGPGDMSALMEWYITVDQATR